MAESTHTTIPTQPAVPIRFTVVVPTLGRERALQDLLLALEEQTLPRDRWDLVVVFDGSPPRGSLRDDLSALNAAVVVLPKRRGPGAARNEGARAAKGDYLAFTEDDCAPAPDWLAAAAARVAHDPELDVLEGATVLPDGSAARRRPPEGLTWLPTNLFVRRSFFQRVGGYCEQFFDPQRGVYFREDSDFGFTAQEADANTGVDFSTCVVHPREHPGWLDPIRWARRYEMDPLLEARHPRAFREEIEVVRLGPVRLRRPFVRVCVGYVVALMSAAGAAVIGEAGVASWFIALAALAAVLIWSKWRFDPKRLPVVPIVPIVLLAALLRGRRRAATLEHEPRAIST